MADRYWVGGTGNWTDDDNHWATESNGSPGDGNLPTSSDNVYFDANSFSAGSQTVTVNANASCADMDWTGVTNTPTFYLNNKNLSIYGNFTLDSAMIWKSNSLGNVYFFSASGTKTITTAGITISTGGNYAIFGDGYSGISNGAWQLQDGFTIDSSNYTSIYVLSGTLDTNDQTVTGYNFYVGRATLDAGTSTFNLLANNYGIFELAENATASVANSTILTSELYAYSSNPT